MFGKLGGHLLFQIDSMLDWSFLRKPQHLNRRNSSKPFFHVLGDLARSLLSRPPPHLRLATVAMAQLRLLKSAIYSITNICVLALGQQICI